MSLNKTVNFHLPDDLAKSIGRQMQDRRLADNLSRKTLAAQSGVPAPTIRHFETSGQISLLSLLRLAHALGCMDNFLALFPEKAALTIDQFIAARRQRGSK